ncbi:YcxB family protein [Massilia forsythiae]|uniref:YcxB family protein n=1 Tax=Massilia forsythiae TaxID=2728020 RepID=A0A7Z2VU39_9BURK|nr:YcxB family protein [Massilia forsythiae]QJD99233.1 YcxB family protein [Massilia forsythiae]
MQIVRQQRKTVAATELTVGMPDGRRAIGPAGPDAPLRFSVAYTLREYLGVVRDHVAFLARHTPPAARRRAVRWPLGLGAAGLALAALLHWSAAPPWAVLPALACGGLALASLPATAPFWVVVLCTPLFAFKRRRMPVCDFRIDGETIERSTRRGVFKRSWSEVRAVRRYPCCYLLVFARGAMPIPLRCLDAGQQERFRAYALARSGA